MTNDDFKKILDEVLKPLKKDIGSVRDRLDDPDTGLKRINERLDSNTAAVMELEKTVKGYADMYKINDSNTRKMEKRVETLEENADIRPPSELQLADVA